MSAVRTYLFAAVAALAALAGLAVAARAESALTSGNALVRGGAPLPRFSPNLPNLAIDLSSPPPGPSLGTPENLEISLTSPDHSVLRFLFSPRFVAGDTFGLGAGVTGTYAGLAWNIFDNDRLFGSIALTGEVNRRALDDPTHRLFGPVLSLHSTLELGYSFNAQQSLSLSLDHASPAPFFGNDLRLRYGYHF